VPADPSAIARIQTPPGRGGIAVIALTGDNRQAVLDRVFRPISSHAPPPGQLLSPDAIQLGNVVDATGQPIDEAIVAHGQSGAIEINIHGGPVVARAVMRRLVEAGASPAAAKPHADESFQLSHPKWNNPAIGKEMLTALPAAASPLTLAVITNQWSAGLSQLTRNDSPAAAQLRQAAGRFKLTAKLLNPPEVVLVGPPNVGKSALANELVGRAVSIVHDRPGTTRDWVRALALFSGVPVWITDTAGLFDPPAELDIHEIDAQSVARARQRAEQADLVLLLSAGQPTATPDWLHAKHLLRVAAKCDACPAAPDAGLAVSSSTGQGLPELRAAVLSALELTDIDPAAPAAFTQRQADLLIAAADAMDRGMNDLAEQKLRALLMG